MLVAHSDTSRRWRPTTGWSPIRAPPTVPTPLCVDQRGADEPHHPRAASSPRLLPGSVKRAEPPAELGGRRYRPMGRPLSSAELSSISNVHVFPGSITPSCESTTVSLRAAEASCDGESVTSGSEDDVQVRMRDLLYWAFPSARKRLTPQPRWTIGAGACASDRATSNIRAPPRDGGRPRTVCGTWARPIDAHGLPAMSMKAITRSSSNAQLAGDGPSTMRKKTQAMGRQSAGNVHLR